MKKLLSVISIPSLDFSLSSGTPTASPSVESAAPSIDCSMFTTVPSCSYISAGQGQDTCKQCFPNK